MLLGVHGRRTPGPGETFWQFRSYAAGEPARRIDWRRSARDHHLYVREREWEASQTVWLYADLSPSMEVRSALAADSKLDRAVVLLLALAEMLSRGGERVGVPGLVEPRIGRDNAERIARALAQNPALAEWPSLDRVKRSSELVMLSDCLSDTATMQARIQDAGVRGTMLNLIQIFDPAEETFPYRGRLEFRDPETGEISLVERAETLRGGYLERLAAHREAIRSTCRKAGFGFLVHHTDRPASEGLLMLHAGLTGSAQHLGQAGHRRSAA